jgi:urease subunit alpha
MRGFHGARGDAPARLSHQFVAAACLDDPAARAALPPGPRYTRIEGSRGLGTADMLHNTARPHVEIPGEPCPVRVDGQEVPVHRAVELPLTRLHHLA